MATTQYIGSRYVPILADPVEWSSTKSYEPLTIVTHEGNSYTSRQIVPVGIDITNTDFWALTGNYNAQIELYRRETTQAVDDARQITDDAVSQVKEWLEIAQGQYGAKPFAFETVAKMQAAYELLYVGAICHTNGFHASGDGGAAWYIISDTGSEDGMGMDVIPCANLYANLIVGAEINPSQLGAQANTDISDILIRCLQLCNKIVFSKKSYIVTKRIEIPSNTILDGNYCTLRFTTDVSCVAFVSGETVINVTIKNFNMNGNSANDCINCSDRTISTPIADCHFENLRISGFNIGIHMLFCWCDYFEKVRCINCAKAMRLESQCNAILFDACYFTNTGAIDFINNLGNTFSCCSFERLTAPMYIYNSYLNFNGCYFESIANQTIATVGAGADNTTEKVTFDSCYAGGYGNFLNGNALRVLKYTERKNSQVDIVNSHIYVMGYSSMIQGVNLDLQNGSPTYSLIGANWKPTSINSKKLLYKNGFYAGVTTQLFAIPVNIPAGTYIVEIEYYKANDNQSYFQMRDADGAKYSRIIIPASQPVGFYKSMDIVTVDTDITELRITNASSTYVKSIIVSPMVKGEVPANVIPTIQLVSQIENQTSDTIVVYDTLNNTLVTA